MTILCGYELPLDPATGARILAMALRGLGGPGSGHYGHAGRPGQVGEKDSPQRHVEPRTLGGPGSGHFGHVGRPGQVGGSAPARNSAQDTLERKFRRILGVDSRKVLVHGHPHTIRAAEITADTLAELKAKGYEMPDELSIVQEGPGFTDSVRGRVASDEAHLRLTLTIPRSLPDDADLDDAVRVAYKDYAAVREFKDVVIHEMAHVNDRFVNKREIFDPNANIHTPKHLRQSEIARRVSRYAASGPDEFIAETFVRMYRGEELDPEVVSLYEQFRGPEVRQ